jgi:V8-like Glu-specific endopeptidase
MDASVPTDLTLSLIEATFQIDQATAASTQIVGTGFLVSVPTTNGPPNLILVTAAHVFEKMPAQQVRISWRIKNAEGRWQYSPSFLTIRNEKGPLWTQNPKFDVAVMPITVPEFYKDKAIPFEWLADENSFEALKVGPNDEMTTLGYPLGFSSNRIGFPILRTGRVASYPLGPVSEFPTFLLDLTAIPGNSGGPVFMTTPPSESGAASGKSGLVTGVLTNEVEKDGKRLEIGLITHAYFIRQTIVQMQAEALSKVSEPSKP